MFQMNVVQKIKFKLHAETDTKLNFICTDDMRFVIKKCGTKATQVWPQDILFIYF